jgi:hypothetical protein
VWSRKELMHGDKGLGAALELLRKRTISLNPGNVVISVRVRTMKGKVVAALNYVLKTRGIGGRAPRFLISVLMEVSNQLHNPDL